MPTKEKSCYQCSWKNHEQVSADTQGERVRCDALKTIVSVATADICKRYPGKSREEKYADRESLGESRKRAREGILAYVSLAISVLSLIVATIAMLTKLK